MRRLTIALSSSAILALAFAVPVFGHHIVSIGCDEDLIEVVANVFNGHKIVVTIDGTEVLNEAVPGGDANHTYTFAYDGGLALVDVKLWNGATLEDSESAEVNCHEPEGEPSVDLDKFVWDEGGLVTEVVAGDPVTYTYEVTNDGETNLDIALLEDLIVSSPGADPGDVACDGFEQQNDNPGNDDAIFEPGETWVYTCTVEDGLPIGETNNQACVYANVAVEVDLMMQVDPRDSDVHSCAEYTVTAHEGETGGGTGTPAASLPNSAVTSPAGAPIATLAFGLLLLSSLGALAFVNVRSSARRR